MFCGYACVVYAMRGEFEHGGAVHRLRHRARHARRPHRADDRHDERRSASSSTRSPTSSRSAWRRRSCRFAWGLCALRPARLGGRLPVRLGRGDAAGALQHPDHVPGVDKRYFVGMPSPAAAGVPAATVFAYPAGFVAGWPYDLLALPMVLVPALLMVSTIRFRSFKTIDLQHAALVPRPAAHGAGHRAIATHPQIALVVVAYGYLASGLHRHGRGDGWLAAPAERRRRPTSRQSGAALGDEPGPTPLHARIAGRAGRGQPVRSGGCGGVSGSAIVTVVPTPRSLSTSIVPPFNSTLRFAIVSPRPVPVALVEKYGSKIRAERLGVHADAGVGDATARSPWPSALRRDRQRAAARHRVQRVLDDVGQRARSSVAIDRAPAAGRRRRRRRSRTPIGERRRGRARRPRAISVGDRVGAGRAIGDEREARELGRDLPQQPHLREDRVDAVVEHRRQRLAAIVVHAPQVLGRQLDRRQRVLDVVRDLPRHVGPRLEAVRALELAALALQVGRHAVEVLDQPPAARRPMRGDDARARGRRAAMRRVARVSRCTGSAIRSAIQ